MAKSSPNNVTIFVTVLAIAAGWATWTMVWPMGLVAYVPLLAWASSAGRKPAIASVMLSPFIAVPIVYGLMGGHDFVQGTARLMARGVPTVESTNLDPRHRVPVILPPRTTDTRNTFGWLAYEGTVRLFGSLSGGTMRGAYAGPYPSRTQAWRDLDAAPDAFVTGDVIKVGTRFATLPAHLDLRHPAALRAHRIGETLVFGHPDQLWLMNETKGTVFATFRRPQPDAPRPTWPGETTPEPAPAVAGGPDRYASPAY